MTKLISSIPYTKLIAFIIWLFTCLLVSKFIYEHLESLFDQPIGIRGYFRSFLLGSILVVFVAQTALVARLMRRGLRYKPSGSTLLRFCRFVLPKATFERIVLEAVNDMWIQQFEALQQGEKWRAKWIGLRDQARILLALGLEPVSKLIYSMASQFIPKK